MESDAATTKSPCTATDIRDVSLEPTYAVMDSSSAAHHPDKAPGDLEISTSFNSAVCATPNAASKWTTSSNDERLTGIAQIQRRTEAL